MEGERRNVNSELWHACAGPCVSLPTVGSLVVYFPQGHSEQVAASTQKEVDGHIPNYPNLQSQLVCQLHNVALHADLETDEVFAQMTLQPVNEHERDLFIPPDVGTPNRQPTDFFCKTLTASDTSTHGGFSVPRRAAEKVFPPLDFNKQPPAQELQARDLHDTVWTFRHIYRGQPKRHLLTTGWSVFVSAKRLVAGDSVLFIRDDKGQMLLGIRRATSRQQSVMPSSVLSSDSMHIGVLAAAAHAAATSSRFQVFYNPRTSPSEFIIPLSKYRKAVHFTQVSVGMRFRMVFETDESTLRRYMGTVTGIGDLDAKRWPGSKWRNLEVGWDESAGERPRRVSLWDIEPVSSPLLICPPFAARLKRPHNGVLLEDENDADGSMRRCLTWPQRENGSTFQGVGGESSWIHFQQGADPTKPEMYDPLHQTYRAVDVSRIPAIQMSMQHALQQQELQPQGIWPQPSSHIQQGFFQNHQLQMPMPVGSLPSTQAQVQGQLVVSHSQSPSLLLQANYPPLPQSHLQSSQSASQHLYPSQIQQHHQQRHRQEQPHDAVSSHATQPPPLVSSHAKQIPVQTPLVSQMNQPLLQTPLANPSPLQASSVSHANQPSTQTPLVSHTDQPPPQTPSVSHTNQPLPQTPSVSRPNQPPLQRHKQAQKTPSVPSNLLQAGAQLPTNVCIAVPASETDGNPGTSSSGSVNQYASAQGNLAVRSHLVIEDSGQLSSMLHTNQSMVQMPHWQQQLQQPPHSQLHLQPQPQTQLHPKTLPQLQTVRSHHHSQEFLSNLAQMESQLTGNWCSLPREPTQCESPMVSAVQIGHSDTSSSAVTSCSYPHPPETLDNNSPLLVPNASASLQQARLSSSNNELQPQGLNEAVVGSFSSSNGSFTSTTPDGGAHGTPAFMANGVLDEHALQRSCSSHWSPVAAPPVRTFTKVHKSGSVGRSIDLSRLKSYSELRRELAHMFNMEGQLEEPQRSYWQLVFVDNVGDILLVGDDPWEEFVSCARAIKILSTSQVLEMNQEGLEQISTLPLQQPTSGSSEECHVWKEP